MNDDYIVAVEGLSALRTLETIPEEVAVAAARAINRTSERARTMASRRIREQVNFPARYLVGTNGRLEMSSAAEVNNLERRIIGRFRPTSLARFASGTPESTQRAGGVRVQVAPGFAKFMRRAFLIRLRAGAADVDSSMHNLGLAIRLRQGETIRNKRAAVAMKGGLTLLYGPSVDQLLATVAEDITPEVGDLLEAEFTRLMDLN